ncbi:chromosome transmission fidelity protein 18 homolog isoform X2 [Varroa jacobsoni]|uniref:chromosome transmission fidelity protein 18 homolog isoform X2 n=1 Tax=Varroa jacobsoni TaxID=62625 RepID=UPI000BFA6D1E|nr:chromosome transmission fidelity protein 18 homolog isoform X2 [Varroa jacobsoni]
MELDSDAEINLKRTLELDQESVSVAKRTRTFSPLGELKIDLGEDVEVEGSLSVRPRTSGNGGSGREALKTDVLRTDDDELPSTSSGIRDMVNKFPVRGSSGRLQFVRQYSRRVLDNLENPSNENTRPSLLSKPFWDLFQEAEEELIRLSHLDTLTNDITMPEGCQDTGQTRSGAQRKESHNDDARAEGDLSVGISGDNDTEKCPSLLWADKYRPRGFMDLLSDTAINRLLLQWIKLWDECVFNRPIKATREKAETRQDTENRFKNKDFAARFITFVTQKQRNRQGFKMNPFVSEISTELDKWRRPMQPVVLLAGPPGLGKTTLAHVLARHSGYNIVELNASDDRSPDAFRSALEGATQMKPVLDRECRPNCLVIDEIDGAPAQSINVLLQMLRSTNGDGSESGGEKKKKKKPKVLLRPVICICNEAWGPALRQLRQTALMLQLPQTQSHRLVFRLQEVLRKERMKYDRAALQALSEKTGNDIRSCLCTLQFLQARKGQTGMISMTDVAGVAVGDKDMEQSLSNVVRSVFSKPTGNPNYSTASPANRQRRSLSVLMLAQSFGDYERLNQALFDTLTAKPCSDSDITEQLVIGLNWLCFADQLNETTHRMQHYALMAYGPFMAQKWQGLFASIKPVKPIINNSFAEFRQRQIRLSSHWASLMSFISPAFLAYHSGISLLVDVMPLIIGIIQPQMRSSNVQLLNDADRLAFRSAVNVMALFGLVYQQRMIDGEYVFQLEPNLEDLVRFPGIASRFTPLSYATKMMFSREIELNKIRQTNEVVSRGTRRKSPEVSAVKKSKPQLDMMKDSEKPRKDFFGRLIQPKLKQESSDEMTAHASHNGQRLKEVVGKEAEGNTEASGIYYKFKEGFSNAVRRTRKIKQVL